MNKCSIFALLVAGVCATPATLHAQSPIPLAGIYGSYPLGEDAKDISGYGHHGAVLGNVKVDKDRSEKLCATRTITQNGVISVPHEGFGFSGDSVSSLSFWVYFDDCTNGSIRLISANNTDLISIGCRPMTAGGWVPSMSLVAANVLGESTQNGVSYANTILYDYKKWYHMVIIAQQSDYKWYVNGQLVYKGKSKQAIKEVREVSFSSNATIFDDIAIFRYALPEAQIKTLYESPGLCDVLTAVEDQVSRNNATRLHPNPASNGAFVLQGGSQFQEMTVLDHTGKVVLHTSQRSVEGLRTGAYFVQVRVDGELHTHQLIVTE